MKATGIVRRIDDLGRVVIPKEIRRTCHIKEGDPLEIFLENGAVVFKKYSYGAALDFKQFEEYAIEMRGSMTEDQYNEFLLHLKKIETIVTEIEDA
jgi:stage V sporulation protein T